MNSAGHPAPASGSKPVITIRHDHKDGTLVYGTSKGDGVFELIGPRSSAGFRFFPSIKMIGIAQSRDRLAKRHQIESARAILVAAGYEVEVEIDDTPRDVTEVKADQAGRLDARFERLTASAAKHLDEGERRRDHADELAGQRMPVRHGHHSAGRARVVEKRLEQNDQAADREFAVAAEASRAASVVGDEAAYRERPSVTRRRIGRLEAELRQVKHKIDGTRPPNLAYLDAWYLLKPAEGDDLAALEAQRAFLEHQLEGDRAAMAVHMANGYVMLTRSDLHVGDVVSWSPEFGKNATVTRVNPKTVSLDRTRWPSKLGYEQIRSVECPHKDTTTTVRAPRAPRQRRAAPVTAPQPVQRDEPVIVDGSFEFYPTPPVIVEQMIAAARLEPDMMVLEPSAGLGGIALPAAQEGCLVTCWELSQNLASRLSGINAGAAGLHVNCGDFLEVRPQPVFDRVLMNPPFSQQQDIAHVTHALSFLKPGGLLVAIMSGGIEWHHFKTSAAFRQLVTDRGGSFTKLPDDAFEASGASVRTVMVVIPAESTQPADPASHPIDVSV